MMGTKGSMSWQFVELIGGPQKASCNSSLQKVPGHVILCWHHRGRLLKAKPIEFSPRTTTTTSTFSATTSDNNNRWDSDSNGNKNSTREVSGNRKSDRNAAQQNTYQSQQSKILATSITIVTRKRTAATMIFAGLTIHRFLRNVCETSARGWGFGQ